MVLSFNEERELLTLKQQFKAEDHARALEFIQKEHELKMIRLALMLSIAQAGGFKSIDSLDK